MIVTEENMTRITEKNHGILLTIWLFLILIGNFFSSISYLFSISTLASFYPNISPSIFYFLGILTFANVIFVIFLFNWKKWAFFALCGVAVITLMLKIFVIKLGIGTLLSGLIGILILYLLLKPKWDLLE